MRKTNKKQIIKTNIVMTRKMGEFDVEQRTSDSMFNATTLLFQWNKGYGKNKELKDFLSNKGTKEFIDALIQEENLNRDNSPYLTLRGKNGGTWMHPYLFVKFAMWINPTFEVKVIKFVYDELIKNRHIAGDKYRLLSASASIFTDVNYVQIAKALNWIVFNKHEKNIRNIATESQLQQLHEVEEKLCFAIDMGFVNSYPELIITMRKMWNDRHCKF